MDRFLIFEEMYVKTLAELKKRPVSPDESGDAVRPLTQLKS